MQRNGRFSLLLITSGRSHTEPIIMVILSMFHIIVNRRFESGSWQELYPLFSVLFYVWYDIFCAVLCRVWHFLCYFSRVWHFRWKYFPIGFLLNV